MAKKKTKPWYKSKTLQGNIALFLTFVASILDIPFSANESDIAVKGLVALLSLIYAVYGRVVSETTLTVRK